MILRRGGISEEALSSALLDLSLPKKVYLDAI